MNYSYLQSYFLEKTSNLSSRRESEICFWLILFEYKGWSKLNFELNKSKALEKGTIDYYDKVIVRLNNKEPIQYILGSTEFYDLKFKVNSGTLIPRPETEELVDLIIKDYKGQQVSTLDIGTGSGCISVSLAKNLPGNHAAIDISRKAIKVAKENAFNNNVDVNFLIDDILNPKESYSKYSIIVSNPPYIPLKDKLKMHENVLDFEPHLALFVNDNNPLKFYISIINFSKDKLVDGGVLYFEIHEDYSGSLKVILNIIKCSYKFYEDLQGKQRMLKIWNLK